MGKIFPGRKRMPFAEGENVGPYRIMEQLGQGGMATVYKAYHAALDRYVALKVLHPAFLEDQTFTARFQREARVVAKLEHPNIVPVYDFAEHETRPYLVMKYIEGEMLKARLSRGALSAVEITQVVDSVGSALAYAHKQGILHRDIKPSNVLISKDGVMYLTDFGLARIAQAGESTLSSDSIMGTPQYISPEQARGDKDLDAGTDIYSFGVMLYEMVVGQVPFNADTPFSIIHDHIYTPLPMPRSINKKVPESVERVLLKALAKERADRYADVPSLVQAFKSAWESAGVPMQGTALTLPSVTAKHEKNAQTAQATGAGKTAVAREPKKKRSPWLFVAGGVLLTICCVFAFFAIRQKCLHIWNPRRKLPNRFHQDRAICHPKCWMPSAMRMPILTIRLRNSIWRWHFGMLANSVRPTRPSTMQRTWLAGIRSFYSEPENNSTCARPGSPRQLCTCAS
jgi:serine/threonine protein kinase